MTNVPANPKIYHITHIKNLPQIISAGQLLSDAGRVKSELDCKIVGMSHIKQRRLEELDVNCHPNTKVGDYVPFYFCHRSIMLYILHRSNHPDLRYSGGQESIVHLQADLQKVVQWAEEEDVRWAFSDRNAGTRYAQFYKDIDKFDKLNWDAIVTTDFRNSTVQEGKQAEFLIYDFFPWNLVEKIGVIDATLADKVGCVLGNAFHKPLVKVEKTWYY